MIPNNSVLNSGFEFKTIPTNTFALNENAKFVSGEVDGQEAMKQAIYLILNIERYQYIIYSWNYGIELADLFGEPLPYIESEVERRIKEALLADDRITAVDSFVFEIPKRNTLSCKFTAHTIFGDVASEKEVII